MVVPSEKSFDAVVIGGGPAGSTIGRLLARWGHSVLILDSPGPSDRSLAECLPPSVRKIFSHLGILDSIDRAGFTRTSGNTFWWGDSEGRGAAYPDPPEDHGYQVLRADLDRFLLDLARESGAEVLSPAHARAAHPNDESDGRVLYRTDHGAEAAVRARFILDCSGRAGVLAQCDLRKSDGFPQTLAILGVWRKESPWDIADQTHTLVEAYEDGWAWSIPISPSVRYFTLMVDPKGRNLARDGGLGAFYHRELRRARRLSELLPGASLVRSPWSCDASVYGASQFAGPGFLLVGDAGSFIDPLSSFGVKKALASAWVGAVAVNTCLRRPEMSHAALDFFSARERQVFGVHMKEAGRLFSEGAASSVQPFWSRRGETTGLDNEPDAREEGGASDQALLAAFAELKRRASIALRAGDGVRTQPKAEIEGREIVWKEALEIPGLSGPVRFYRGVDLPLLFRLAPGQSQVPDLFEAYNRRRPPVELPQFLGALAFLIARGALREAGVFA